MKISITSPRDGMKTILVRWPISIRNRFQSIRIGNLLSKQRRFLQTHFGGSCKFLSYFFLINFIDNQGDGAVTSYIARGAETIHGYVKRDHHTQSLFIETKDT